MILLLALPIAIIDTLLLYMLITRRHSYRGIFAERQRTLTSSLMRFTFASQLVMELLTGSKLIGCIFSFMCGLSAGLLTEERPNLSVLADIFMNVFMGISMGIFLIGNMPLSLTILLISPVLLASCFTFLHTSNFLRNRSS